MMRDLAVIVVAAAMAASCAPTRGGRGPGSPRPGGFVFDAVRVAGREHRFAIWVPEGYDPRRAWPTIVFLNGSGECGIDGVAPTRVGLGPALRSSPGTWPFLVVFPQKPVEDDLWLDWEELVLAILDAVRAGYAVDPARTYLTGMSQGGAGTWMIGARHPDRFAALAPVCGWGDPAELAPALAAVPVWAFHGALDDVVPPDGSRKLVEAIRAAGGEADLTIFPDANHNSWDRAYAGDALAAWFLRHRGR